MILLIIVYFIFKWDIKFKLNIFNNITRNRYLVIDNILKICHDIQYNLINPLPTYHFEKENERNSLSPSPSPIFFFPRDGHSNSFIRHQLGRKINEVFPHEDDVLVTGKKNVSLSPTLFPTA
jgi:hypothetical protein